MQFDARHGDEILSGQVTLTFRRWKRRQAVPGNTYRTLHGRIRVDSVEAVEPDSITEADARQAGYATARALLDSIGGDVSLPLHRVAFRLLDEPDPRQLLAESADLTDDERTEIDRRLDRLDRSSSHEPWTRATLQLIADHPRTRAADLAAMVGRDTAPFKLDVRKLKDLGLTLSHDVGYELSPRGRAYWSGPG